MQFEKLGPCIGWTDDARLDRACARGLDAGGCAGAGAAAVAAARGPGRGDGEGRPLEPPSPPPRLDRRGRRDRGGGADRARLPADDAAAGSRAAAGGLGGAARPGGGARPRRPRPPRRGPPVADRAAAAVGGGARGGAPGAGGRTGEDESAGEPGDDRAALAGAAAAPDRTRRPGPGSGDRRSGRAPRRRDRDPARRRRRLLRPRRRRPARRLPGRPGGAFQRRPPQRRGPGGGAAATHRRRRRRPRGRRRRPRLRLRRVRGRPRHRRHARARPVDRRGANDRVPPRQRHHRPPRRPGRIDSMRVLIADDHGIVRSGLRLLLERQPDIEVIAEAGDGAEARDLAVRERPDLAILDVKMPKLTGLEATREVKEQAPEVSVLILSMHDDERYLFEALKAGASGYVLKAQADTDLLAAIRAVERGEPFLTPGAQRALIKDVLERGSSGEEELTPREEEIVKLVAEAHTSKEIAELLHLSEKTVENHRANAMRKLGMRDRVELVRYAIRRGLIEP